MRYLKRLLVIILFLSFSINNTVLAVDDNNKKDGMGIVELGNWDFRDLSFQKDSRITWDVITQKNYWNLSRKALGVKTVFEWDTRYDPNIKNHFDMTDLNLIGERFDLAVQYADLYDYGIFLFQEEIYTPIEYVRFGEINFNKWHLDGTSNLSGIEVKLLRTWYIEKYGGWNKTWWNNIVETKNLNDKMLNEWNIYYSLSLYKAWDKHMKSLGKKTVGLVYNGNEHVIRRLYPSPVFEYIIENYDLLFVYPYPKTLEQIEEAKNNLKFVRSVFNGSIGYILNHDFGNDLAGWEKDKALTEFEMAFENGADIIMVMPYIDMRWPGLTQPYPPVLLEFYDKFLPKYTPTLSALEIILSIIVISIVFSRVKLI